MEEKQLPKKIRTNEAYAEAAKEFILKKRDEAGGVKPFFKLVYGRESIGNEGTTFNNNINRGKYAADFVGELIESLDLHDVTLSEFFGTKK